MIQHIIKFCTQLNPIKSTDDAIGFLSGCSFMTLFITAMDWQIFLTFMGHALGALIIGVVGGWAGLMGKDLYKYVSCKTIYKFFNTRRFRRKPKNKSS